MSPEQQAIVKALLMQGGQMTPMQQYQNAADNSAGGMHPAQKRFMAGNPVAKEPFDPLEALSAPQAMEQALMGGESRAPATSPRPQASPLDGLLSQMPSGFASVFSDLSPQEQQGIIGLMQQGAPVDQAFDAVLGQEMNATTRGR